MAVSDIFISYSRKDSGFVAQLRAALVQQGRNVWIDTNDILPSSHWRQEIIDAIAAASTIIFVISPDWVASEVSQRELQYAVEMQKKLIPLVWRDVDHRQVNPALGELNWIFARSTDNPGATLQQLAFALDTDLDYWRAGGDLLVKARQWEQGARRPAYTLRGEALRRAEQWLADGATKRPGPSALQVEYINAGRHATSARQRTLIGALTAGFTITLVLAIIASVLSINLTIDNRHLTAGDIAGKANALALNHQYDQALLFAAEANRQDDTAQTRNALNGVMDNIPYINSFVAIGTTGTSNTQYNKVSFSADGKILMYTDNVHITLWDTAKYRIIRRFTRPATPDANKDYSDALLSPDGKTIAIAKHPAGEIDFIDAVTGQPLGPNITSVDDFDFQAYGEHWAFSPDSKQLAWEACHSATTCKQRSVYVYNVATHALEKELSFSQWNATEKENLNTQVSVTFSPDSTRLFGTICMVDPVDSCTQSSIYVWNTATFAKPQILTSGKGAQFTSVAISPDGKTLAVSGSISLCPTVLACTYASVATYDPQTLHNLDGVTEPRTDIVANAQNVTYSGDGKSLIAQVGLQHLGVFDADLHDVGINETQGLDIVNAKDLVANFAPNSFTDLVSSPVGNTFATTDTQGNVILWNAVTNGAAAQHVVPVVASSPAVSLDAATILTVTADDHLITRNRVTGQQEQSIATGLDSNISTLAASGDGKLVALGDDQSVIHLFSFPGGQPVGAPLQLTGIGGDKLTDDITRLAISPDKHYLAASDLSDVVLFDLHTGQQLHNFTEENEINLNFDTLPLGIAFSPDSRTLAYATPLSSLGKATPTPPQAIVLYDLAAAKTVTTITGGAGQTTALAFNADGTHLAAYDDSGTVRLLDTTNIAKIGAPSQIIPFVAPPSLSSILTGLQAISVQFTGKDDSEKLLITGADTLALWNVATRSFEIAAQHYDKRVLSATLSDDNQETELVVALQERIILESITGPDLRAAACHIAARNLTAAEYAQFNLGPQPATPTCHN